MRAAIVEDETLIRAGIRKKLELLGTEVVFDTNSGCRLLEYLEDDKALQPDILFADICMPVMDGLELMEKVRMLRSEIPIVVLSGYNNFEYARTAMRLGVHDYLLKPVNQDEMKNVLQKLEQQLQERIHADRQKELEDTIENLAGHISCRGSIPLTENSRKALARDFPHGFLVRLVLLSNWESKYTWFGREPETDYCFIYPDRPNLLVSLIETEDKAELKEDLKDIPFTAYYSRPIEAAGQIYHAVRKGIRSIKDHLALEKQQILEQGKEKDDQERLRQWEEYSSAHYEILLREIEEKNLEEVKKQIRGIMQFPGIPQSVRNQAWLWISWKICELYGIRNGIEDTAWVQEYDTLASFTQGVTEAVLQLLSESGQMESMEQEKTVLEEILDYMHKDFAQDITLKGTSEKFFINRSHLARIFKLKTGTTFNNYLTDLRIEKACRLMKEGVPICRAAEMVGYDNSRYFSRVFCKVKGCIPSRYRDGGAMEENGEEGLTEENWEEGLMEEVISG